MSNKKNRVHRADVPPMYRKTFRTEFAKFIGPAVGGLMFAGVILALMFMYAMGV